MLRSVGSLKWWTIHNGNAARAGVFCRVAIGGAMCMHVYVDVYVNWCVLYDECLSLLNSSYEFLIPPACSFSNILSHKSFKKITNHFKISPASGTHCVQFSRGRSLVGKHKLFSTFYDFDISIRFFFSCFCFVWISFKMIQLSFIYFHFQIFICK